MSHLGMYRIKYTKLTLSCTLVKHTLYVSVLAWVPAYIKQNQESGNNFFPSLYLLVSVHLVWIKAISLQLWNQCFLTLLCPFFAGLFLFLNNWRSYLYPDHSISGSFILPTIPNSVIDLSNSYIIISCQSRNLQYINSGCLDVIINSCIELNCIYEFQS